MPLDNPKLAQVAIVVRDIAAASARWAELLGQPVPNVIETAPGLECRADYRGVPTDARAKLAFLNLGGGVQLELIEPIGEDSAWAEGLAEKGERLHHIAFHTADPQAADDAIGAPRSMRGDMGERGEYAYYDGAAAGLGATIEILSNDAKR